MIKTQYIFSNPFNIILCQRYVYDLDTLLQYTDITYKVYPKTIKEVHVFKEPHI